MICSARREIRYGELPALERNWRRETPEAPMVKEEVDEDDIRSLPQDPIPSFRGQTEKLIHMEERLHH